METRHQLQGIELRYALTMYLLQHGPTTVDELIKALKWQGFEIGGRPSKQVSDALRWERRRGRVRRLARGLYGPGYRAARDRVPDLQPCDGPARRGETLVVQGNPAVGPFVARYAGNFIYAPGAPRRPAVSPRPPIAHRPRRFRGHGYHAPCRTLPAPEPAGRTRARPPSGWRPIRCPASGSTGSR